MTTDEGAVFGMPVYGELDSRVERLRGGLIVSCQAYPGEPMNHAATMTQVAASVALGGAAAVRVQGPEVVAQVRETVAIPVIGLWKRGDAPVFITPGLDDALAVYQAGADVVALDGTSRTRPDGLTLEQTIRRFKQQADAPVMADCGSLDDARRAEDAGADLIGTTLSGYTGARPLIDGPDFELVSAIAERCSVPVVLEGRVETPAHMREGFAAGAFAVCVGTAITHPGRITARFVRQLEQMTASTEGRQTLWPA
ncbi:MAG: N-acetylmannosamine-6-phosphate 2-epimerase [Bifidobacteriaceae bacterium]|jgi:N-acylglucosamine-6-phosphate 2-epimerase|nr:N-acetylmannosamine-6-phosphate 2-epimerase [Bifidobacteriaceae bacterium]